MKKVALTTYDAARYCDVSPRTVVQWISDGKIKAYRTPGRHSRIKIKDFLEFLTKYNIPVPDELKAKRSCSGRKKILTVDDDQTTLLMIKQVLESDGSYDVETAVDGFDAGRKVTEFRPDLIILDIRMPGMDGYAVMKTIKKSAKLSRIKIVAVSSFFEEEGKAQALSLGADKCLDKPFDRKFFLNEIKMLLDDHGKGTR